MTRRLALAAALLAASATAAPAQPTDDDEFRLPEMEQMDRTMRDLMEDLEPAFDEMFRTLQPAFEDIIDYMRGFEVIDDPRHYEVPEVLPNGDIIIRRRDDAPPFDPEAPEDHERPWPRGGIRT